jgi:hypothetical protein
MLSLPSAQYDIMCAYHRYRIVPVSHSVLENDAVEAVEKVNQSIVQGKKIFVELAKVTFHLVRGTTCVFVQQ